MSGPTFTHKGAVYEIQPDGSGRRVGPAPGGQGIAPNPIKVREAQANIAQSGASTNKANADAVKTGAEIPNVRLTGQKIIRDLRQTPISEEDAKRIDTMRQSLGDMGNTLNILNQAAATIDRFNPGPDRAAVLKSSTPDPESGIMGSIGAGFNKLITGTTDRDIEDYKAMLRAQNEGVQAKQIEQRGTQTESDAIRMAMAGLSVDKPKALNARIVADAILAGMLRQQRPDFFTKWANRNGSLGALENGKSVDQAWDERVQAVQRRYNSDPRIRRLQGGGRQANDADAALLRKYGIK